MLSRASIRSKIFLSFLILVVMISLVFFVSSYLRITDTINKEFVKYGNGIIETFSELVTPYIFESDYVEIQSIANRLIAESDIGFIAVIEANGEVWISTAKHSEKPLISSLSPSPPIRSIRRLRQVYAILS